MNIGVHQLIVALVMLVPGFIATGIQRAFLPRRFSSDLHWTVTSLLISTVLNLVLGFASFIILFGIDTLSLPLPDVGAQFQAIPTWAILTYVIFLYLSAMFWGAATGAFPQLGLRAILNRLGIISFAEDPSIWDRVFTVRKPADRPITWLRLNLDDGKTIFGHLRHSSEHIDKDKPFEIYLDEPHELSNGRWIPLGGDMGPQGADGVYLRLMLKQMAEFHFRENGWTPNKGGAHEAQHIGERIFITNTSDRNSANSGDTNSGDEF